MLELSTFAEECRKAYGNRLDNNAWTKMANAGVYINSVLVLDSNSGARIHAKYFAGEFAGSPEKQLAFEKKLHSKSVASSEADVLMLEGSLAVYCMGTDVFFYVIGSTSENEIILQIVLEAFVGTLKSVLKQHLDKHTILDNLELLLLTVDEIVDAGTVLETDVTVLTKRVMLRNADGSSAVPAVSISNASELTLSGAFNIAREGLAKLTRS